MILEGIIRLFFGVVNLLLAFIPKIELPKEFAGYFGDVAYLFSFASYFLPIPAIMSCLGIVFVIDNAKFLMSIFNWVVSKIPTIS